MGEKPPLIMQICKSLWRPSIGLLDLKSLYIFFYFYIYLWPKTSVRNRTSPSEGEICNELKNILQKTFNKLIHGFQKHLQRVVKAGCGHVEHHTVVFVYSYKYFNSFITKCHGELIFYPKLFKSIISITVRAHKKKASKKTEFYNFKDVLLFWTHRICLLYLRCKSSIRH